MRGTRDLTRPARRHPHAMSLPEPSPSSAALVTGASAGIGAASRASSRRAGTTWCSSRGARSGSSSSPTELVAEHGVRAETISCDLARPASARPPPRPDRGARARRRDPRQQRRLRDQRPVPRGRRRARARAGARARRGGGRAQLGVRPRRWSSAAPRRDPERRLDRRACSRSPTPPATRPPRRTC